MIEKQDIFSPGNDEIENRYTMVGCTALYCVPLAFQNLNHGWCLLLRSRVIGEVPYCDSCFQNQFFRRHNTVRDVKKDESFSVDRLYE